MAEWINDPQGREEIEKVTKELKLPVWKANYKGKFRDFWNELWDKIEDYILKLKGDTEKNSKGLNDRLVSAVGKHDGDFPIANAVVGNVYYSELTKKYYKCKVGGPAPMPNGNFIDMSILENLNRLENLFSLNLIRTSQKKGYKFYEKPSHTGNYINVSDTFSNVDFCVISPYRVELTDAEAKLINYQGFDGRNILINAMWINGSSIEKKYNSIATNSINTASCIAFVYGTLK